MRTIKVVAGVDGWQVSWRCAATTATGFMLFVVCIVVVDAAAASVLEIAHDVTCAVGLAAPVVLHFR